MGNGPDGSPYICISGFELYGSIGLDKLATIDIDSNQSHNKRNTKFKLLLENNTILNKLIEKTLSDQYEDRKQSIILLNDEIKNSISFDFELFNEFNFY